MKPNKTRGEAIFHHWLLGFASSAQPTQLNLANKGQNAFLGQEGIKMLDAWLNAPTSMDPAKRTMVAPIVMASADWIGEPDAFNVGGNVSGLVGTGLVLQNESADDLTVSTNGAFVFATPLNDGSEYAVSVQTQPTSPDQTCTVANGSGTVDGMDITDVIVTCVSDYRLSVKISGLGTVTSDPAGIDCGNTCSADFVAGSEVILTAEHDPSWTFGSWVWTGACTGNGECKIMMDSDKETNVAFHCELITIPNPQQVIDATASWECYDLEAMNGFEVAGPNGDVSFIAERHIELGPGFKVGAGATFHALINP